jgi:excisionase family DNA binding protein
VEHHEPTHQPVLGLTISEAARFLGVSLSTVRRWSDAGVLPSYRTPGGQRRYNREQLESFLNGLRRGAS